MAASWMNKIHFPAETEFSAEQLWGPCNIIAIGYFGFFSLEA
jgi:hypothetical protein